MVRMRFDPLDEAVLHLQQLGKLGLAKVLENSFEDREDHDPHQPYYGPIYLRIPRDVYDSDAISPQDWSKFMDVVWAYYHDEPPFGPEGEKDEWYYHYRSNPGKIDIVPLSDDEFSADQLVGFEQAVRLLAKDQAPLLAKSSRAEEGKNAEATAADLESQLRALIAIGESSTVEFKQSLEYVDPNHPFLEAVPEANRPTKIKEAQAKVVHSALKTVCAFINSKGGTLLVGVHDKDGYPGIEPDFALISPEKDRNPDGWERKFRQLLDTRLNRRPLDLLTFEFIKIDGVTVAKITVEPSPEPHYLDNEYFKRDGNRTITLVAGERDDYIARRRKEVQ